MWPASWSVGPPRARMESLGEILKKVPTPGTSPGANTGTSSATKSQESQDLCPRCGGDGFVYPSVPVGHPDFGRALPCQCTLQQWEKEKRQRLARYSNLGPLSRLTFEALATQGRPPGFLKALEEARAFAQEPQGWLVLVGPTGSGKTSLAAAIANYRLDLGYPALFVSLVDLLDHLRSSFSPQSPA